MSERGWEHPHGPLPAYDPKFASGIGGYHCHYIEQCDSRPKRFRQRSGVGPACRNTVADFEVSGDVVTCKTCLRLVNVKSRVGLLVLSR